LKREEKGRESNMQQIYTFLIGIAVLALGIPLGNLLAKATKDEIKAGKKWFKLIILFSLIGAVVFLFLGNDPLLFGFLFIAIVTSRSVKK
jgi:hypothetical protein